MIRVSPDGEGGRSSGKNKNYEDNANTEKKLDLHRFHHHLPEPLLCPTVQLTPPPAPSHHRHLPFFISQWTRRRNQIRKFHQNDVGSPATPPPRTRASDPVRRGCMEEPWRREENNEVFFFSGG